MYVYISYNVHDRGAEGLHFITLGAHAQRGLRVYGSWVCVCVCLSVCLSVTQHLTSRTFIRPTKDMTYLTGDEGQKFGGVFSENAPLQS